MDRLRIGEITNCEVFLYSTYALLCSIKDFFNSSKASFEDLEFRFFTPVKTLILLVVPDGDFTSTPSKDPGGKVEPAPSRGVADPGGGVVIPGDFMRVETIVMTESGPRLDFPIVSNIC